MSIAQRTIDRLAAVQARLLAVPPSATDTNCRSYSLACKSLGEAHRWVRSDDAYADQRANDSLLGAESYLARIEPLSQAVA